MRTTRELKAQSREIIKRRLRTILFVVVTLIVLNYLLAILVGKLSGYTDYYSKVSAVVSPYLESIRNASSIDELTAIFETISGRLPEYQMPSTASMVLAVVVFLCNVLISVGYSYHTMLEARGEETGARTLFYPFNFALKVLAIEFIHVVLAFVGYMLFIIPGIIIDMRYSMAQYVLYDDPELGVLKCLHRSARLMRGNKMRLFKLVFSFVLWYIASSLVTAFVMIPLLDFWLYPYRGIATGLFYSEIKES
jgi:uncharacterized membrane protein